MCYSMPNPKQGARLLVPVPLQVDSQRAQVCDVKLCTQTPEPSSSAGMTRPRRLPELLLPSIGAAAEADFDSAVLAADASAPPSLEALRRIDADGDGEPEANERSPKSSAGDLGQDLMKRPARSPIKFQLPASPVLRVAWARGEAAYDRLRRQQLAKKARLARRREVSGLVTISEAHATLRHATLRHDSRS